MKIFTVLYTAVFSALFISTAHAANFEQPNILFIMADDLGYGHLGSYGQTRIRTPNLDVLAAEGMRFTQFYAGSPLCAPSRSVLLTGQHTGHTRIRHNQTRRGERIPLRDEDVTIAEVLKKAGYATGAIGKWGLGEAGTSGHPNLQGFDYWFGFLNQRRAHRHYPDFLWRNGEKVFYPDNKDVTGDSYANDLMTDEAISFITRSRDKPFFLYLAYTIPHTDIVVPENSLAAYRDAFPEQPFNADGYIAEEPRAALAGMITRMDEYIGELLDLLAAEGIAENTLVFFTSDNGPADESGADLKFFDAAGPLRGGKGDLYEGGIRVPMIVRWPAHVRAGAVDDSVWAFWDVFPTLAELAGASGPPAGIDGVSILPALRGEDHILPDRHLYWELEGRNFMQAARISDWKAVRFASDQPLELYKLDVDPGETTDVAMQNSDVILEIERYLETAREPSSDWPTTRMSLWDRIISRLNRYKEAIGEMFI